MGRPLGHSGLRQITTTTLLLVTALILQTIPAVQSAALIVRYTDAAVQQGAAQAAAAGAATPESVPARSAAAAAAAAARGESRAGQQRVAALAAATAEVTPVINVLSDRVSLQAARSGLKVQRREPITTVFKGAVLEFDSSSSSDQVLRFKKQLEKDPSVQKVWVPRTVKVPTPVTNKPAAGAAAASTNNAYSSSAVATGIQALQQRHPGLDGSGTLICVIDTGVNYRLDLFGSCTAVGQPAGSCRVVTGYDLVGDLYNGYSGGPPPVGGNDPTDCYGHGTDVASVAATENGIAPNASIGAYRVFGCDGVTTDAIIIPAIDRAVRDGCHVINLSLTSGSGYAYESPYTDVMAAAAQQGVLTVKSAGNDGNAGWFQADVAVAAGSAAIGSVGQNAQPLNSVMAVSVFSSFGPDPDLTLGPHACAPGNYIPVMTNTGNYDTASGTSFSAPYTSGMLALWRQYRQNLAQVQGQTLDLSYVSQDVMKERLAISSKPVIEASSLLAEPVLRCGGGVIQADVLVENQLVARPSIISLPSNIVTPFTTTLTLSWEGPAHPDRFVTYVITHLPAYSVPLGRGWYGNDYKNRRMAIAADVVFASSQVVVDTTSTEGVQIQITISLPQELQDQALLYSGYVVLTPTSNNTSNGTAAHNCNATGNSTNSTGCTGAANATTSYPVPPISVPYQGYSKSYTRLRILAREPPNGKPPKPASNLAAYANSVCYAPYSQPQVAGSVEDSGARVPGVCSGGFADKDNKVVDVSLKVLRNSPECSLRVTLVPEVPMKWLNMSVFDHQSDKLLGSLTPIYTGSSSLTSSRAIWSWCLGFDGFVSARTNATRRLQIGRTYKLRAFLTGPLAAGDAAAGVQPARQKAEIRGVINVVR